ncbi:ATP-binding cassette domain-containing protein [Microlunatus speluncae]|uniref:ATP-binding cassette domain-containing protein n=1 Tax=Microlunatus speluncae TaxID=2594267 RepID=UPI00126628B7|nr:ATP-binding cassette domain-containing protein [Microlunatus speluncae]
MIASIASLVTATAVCVSVWVISPAAGVVVLLALLSSVIIFAWEARVQDAVFLDVGLVEQRSTHALGLLVGQRTGIELAGLGSPGVVVSLSNAERVQANRIMDGRLRTIMRADAFGCAATAMLLGAARVGVVRGGVGAAGFAAGVVGVLAGLEPTRGAGFAFGDVISFTPNVTVFRAATSDLEPRGTDVVAWRADRVDRAGVSVRYEPERLALDSFTPTVRRGEMVAIAGANGGGKTTAVGALVGDLAPSSGSIRLSDRPVGEIDGSDRRGQFGPLARDFGRYEFSVRDAVRLGRAGGDAEDSAIWAAVNRAHLGDLVASMPDGFETQVGEQFDGVGLSGGGWQRLALERLYLRDAPIWILDEPTSSIDALAEESIFEDLRQSKEDRVTVVVSHRESTLRSMGRICVLVYGSLAGVCTYHQFVKHNAAFRDLFAAQLA